MCLELILHPEELSPSTFAPISEDEDVLCIMQLRFLRSNRLVGLFSAHSVLIF